MASMPLRGHAPVTRADGLPAYSRRPDLPAQNQERIERARQAQKEKETRLWGSMRG
jgi:hypothetical protein